MSVVNYFDIFSFERNYKKIKKEVDFFPMVRLCNYGISYDKIIDTVGLKENFLVDDISIAKYIRSNSVNNKLILCERNYSEKIFIDLKKMKMDVIIDNYGDLRLFLKLNQIFNMNKVGLYLKFKDNFSKNGFDIENIDLIIDIIRHNDYKGNISFIFEFLNSIDYENKYNINFERFKSIEKKISSFIADCYIINDFALFKFDRKNLDFDYSSLFGLSGNFFYENVITFKTVLDCVRCFKFGNKKINVGVIYIGFKNGYLRNSKSKVPILIDGKKFNVIGTVKAELIIVDLKEYKNIKEGSEVVLWGDSLTGQTLPIYEVSSYATNTMRKMIDMSAKVVPMNSCEFELKKSS